jgi:hypothetical protein
VLFKIDMCRLGEQRRTGESFRMRKAAVVSFVFGVNAIVLGLFVQSVIVAEHSTKAAEQRLGIAEEAVARVVGDSDAFSGQQMSLLKGRQKRVRLSNALENVARLMLDEMWVARVSTTEGVPAGGGEPVRGLAIVGTIEAAHREEGISKLMTFVQALRTDPEIRKDFLEATLVTMAWESERRGSGIEFEVFCPLIRPDVGEEVL